MRNDDVLKQILTVSFRRERCETEIMLALRKCNPRWHIASVRQLVADFLANVELHIRQDGGDVERPTSGYDKASIEARINGVMNRRR